jgi:hypothetical protein
MQYVFFGISFFPQKPGIRLFSVEKKKLYRLLNLRSLQMSEFDFGVVSMGDWMYGMQRRKLSLQLITNAKF